MSQCLAQLAQQVARLSLRFIFIAPRSLLLQQYLALCRLIIGVIIAHLPRAVFMRR
jgi:hypothetical protein